jgi:hypothetical protein
MAWTIVAALAGIVALLVALYRRALREATHLNALAILILLDEDVYKSQRQVLHDFVTTTPAQNAVDLSNKVHRSLGNLATRLAGSSVMGSHCYLWKLSQTSRTSVSE